MQVEEAIASAKTFFEKVLAEEQISQVRLKEVEYDEADQAWLVTLSAVQPSAFVDRWTALADKPGHQRSYKTAKIDDGGSRLPSVKIGHIHGEA